MSIGKRLREARKNENITAKQLAEKAGVPEKTIYRIETEEVSDPKISSVIPLIKALNCSADAILFEPDEFVSLGQLKQTLMQASNLNEYNLDLINTLTNALSLKENVERQLANQLAGKDTDSLLPDNLTLKSHS